MEEFGIPGPGRGVTREATVGALVGCRMPLPDVSHGIAVPTACARVFSLHDR